MFIESDLISDIIRLGYYDYFTEETTQVLYSMPFSVWKLLPFLQHVQGAEKGGAMVAGMCR